MDQTLLDPLNQLETSLNTLLTSLTTTNTYAAAPGAAQSLVEADDNLSSALLQLKQHQDNYNRILKLRAEADKLQNQLRDIVRTCVELRGEIGQIHPSILEDTDSDADDDDDNNADQRGTAHTSSVSATTTALGHVRPGNKRTNNLVDYETLLGFAARIGKHNAAAAVEAERQSNRRYRQETEAGDLSGGDRGNGSQGNGPDDTNGSDNQQQQQQRNQRQDASESAIIDTDPAPNITITTDESLAELAAINDTLAQQRAYRGMAFPAAEALRMGALGKLQYLREQEGEDAVEREVERLVRESEGYQITSPSSTATTTKATSEAKDGAATASASESASQSERQPPKPAQPSALQSQAQTRPPPSANLPPKPKMTLDLDFPDSDEDDD